MSKVPASVLAFLFLLISTLLLAGCSKSTVEIKNLPWQASLNEQGQLEVFGITLGKSTLSEVVNQWHQEAKVALFDNRNGEHNLEGYFGRVKLGLFSAQLVARLKVPPELMDKFIDGRIKRAPMPSGVHRYKLKGEHLRQAYELAVEEITYIPAISSDDELLRQRFGEPAERQDLAEGRSLWFYPKKGIVIILDEKDKEVFQYFNPENYQQVRERLEAGQKKAALVGG
jgi:hypothetical protein